MSLGPEAVPVRGGEGLCPSALMELERRAEGACGWAEVAGLGAEFLLNPVTI